MSGDEQSHCRNWNHESHQRPPHAEPGPHPGEWHREVAPEGASQSTTSPACPPPAMLLSTVSPRQTGNLALLHIQKKIMPFLAAKQLPQALHVGCFHTSQ